ncbi:MAG: hypothetical protein H3C34_13305 [Caldilineaceae bacterium]|nr:hypothetical protein [Caldilineaceae bacterium]
MQTYSHLIITAFADDRLKQRRIKVSTKAFLLGSVLPDIPLMVLTIWFLVYHRWIAPPVTEAEGIFGRLYDEYFFHDPVWIISHNFFHAPLILGLLGVIGFWALRRGYGWGAPVFWLALAGGLHTAIDVVTHRNDGPLLLFPLDWSYRFTAPVSYWDARYGAGIVAPLEHLMDLAFIIFLLAGWLRRRRASKIVA